MKEKQEKKEENLENKKVKIQSKRWLILLLPLDLHMILHSVSDSDVSSVSSISLLTSKSYIYFLSAWISFIPVKYLDCI